MEELKRSMLTKASALYVVGFIKAKEQLKVIDLNFDTSRIGFLKEIKDGQVMRDEDPYPTDLPFLNDDGEESEDGENQKEDNVRGDGELGNDKVAL